MNILVCAKRVPMTGGTIVLTEDEQSIQTRHLGFTISPHEECGVEEAVRLIEANGGESVVLALGPSEAEEQLRDAMALGIDRAILLETADEFDGQATAAAIVAAIEAERAAGVEFDLIFFGNESADSGNYQVGIRVAHALGRPCVTGVKGITVQDGRARCEQETASGRDVYDVPLPAVVTVKEGLNLPRYPSVPGRLRAKRKPLATSAPASRDRGRREAAAAAAARAGQAGGDPRPRARGCAGRRRGAAPGGAGGMTLVYVEHQDGRPDDASLQAIALAREIAGGAPLHALLAGPGAEDAAAGLGAHGVATAHIADHEALATHAPVALARCIGELIERLSPAAVAAAGSERGNEVLAHAAALGDLPLAANCIAAEAGDPMGVTRIRWGGSLLEDARLHGPVKLLTVAPHTVEAAEVGGGPAAVERFTPSLGEADLVVRVVETVQQSSEGGVNLADARFVVSCGRGAGSPEGFAPAEELAALLGGAVGCSRAVTIAGWRSHTDQVGQTGTKIAPEVYLACGISGATQHMAGCKGAKRIIAVNVDPEAPIIANADYAVIGDLHEVIPAITAELRKAGAG